MASGKSKSFCSRMLKRTGYKFHLRSYTFQLTEQQKAYRKQMCIDFERAVWESPEFIEVKMIKTNFYSYKHFNLDHLVVG